MDVEAGALYSEYFSRDPTAERAPNRLGIIARDGFSASLCRHARSMRRMGCVLMTRADASGLRAHMPAEDAATSSRWTGSSDVADKQHPFAPRESRGKLPAGCLEVDRGGAGMVSDQTRDRRSSLSSPVGTLHHKF